MKKVLLSLLFMAATIAAYSQSAKAPRVNATIDASGNFRAIPKAATKAADMATGKTYTAKDGEVYPVYKTAKGRFYIKRVSKKTGKAYRYYLVTE